ncbi:GNAT family N-acetyltransferase [Lactobacillus paragasseri]|uniref:GNAT family N-acetyltransferase n=1 Tax=Lactobacillus paragasseri TaxID=2107999 RepID=A0ABD4ZYI2_9LACO|nr:GNAT family N-acetyltransferase [Lactobacillus paragasseri]MDK7951910.1 GNAT family N-acetyltransferase [Lactobacillus paragasseri]MDO6360565.1 GNAT family N-acetyltransferase [Lactobacillus paragasseri]MDX5059418.1 GNAT family N-acetyltransferase [Lactobacillus paragasseri]
MIIRRVTMDDLEEVVNLESAAFKMTKEQTRNDMVGRIENYPDTFLVAQEDGKVIGHIFGPTFNKRYIEDELYFENHPNQKDDRYQMVLSLAVLPEYRKQGVATKLIEAMTQEARKQNRQAISLTCLPKLIKFYEKRGFHNEGKTSDDIPDPTGVTSVNMIRAL